MGKVIAFDLDETLCTRSKDETNGPEKYEKCVPIERNIALLNKLRADGHTILIYTSRGMTFFSGNVQLINRKILPLTVRQLAEWGVGYDKLIMGKPHYDVFVDDKALNALNPFLSISIDNLLNKRLN